MNGDSILVDRELVDAVSAGEILLIRAQALARKVEEQVLQAMHGSSPQPPHAEGASVDGAGG